MKNKEIDSILSYVLIKTILTNPITTDAYDLGLIDNVGNVIKEPVTDEENQALTVLDKLGFKLRRMLGSRISELSTFAYIKTIPDKYQNLLSTNSIEKKAMIKRVKRDIENLAEVHSITFDEMIKMYLNESLKE